MAAFALLFDNQRKQRFFRDRFDTLDTLSDNEVVQQYRLPREGIYQQLELIKDDISPKCMRRQPLDVLTKVFYLINSLLYDT